MSQGLGLFSRYRPDEGVAWRDSRLVTQQAFLHQVFALAERLPEQRYIINLCRDRYNFTLAFCAALIRGTSNLLPPNRQPETVTEIASEYQVSNCLVDDGSIIDGLNCIDVREEQKEPLRRGTLEMPVIAADQVAVIAFTSGSTGKPVANIKCWRTLVGTSKLLAKRFFENISERPNIVATVPAQHMYGLEMSVMAALHGGGVMVSAHPFFPQEVAESLAQIPEPRCLVTTPVHMRAMVGSGVIMPHAVRVVSATAPLTKKIARQTELLFGCDVEEIYGCTEAGSLASRRTVIEDEWHLLDGMALSKKGAQVLVDGDHLTEATPLQDNLELVDICTFNFIGRASDLVNIAGKRISLADVTRKLLCIDGVDDAIVFIPGGGEKQIQRLAALVVSDLSNHEICQQLVRFLDPVFIPRPLKRVAQLPRNELGKVMLHAAQDIIKQGAVID